MVARFVMKSNKKQIISILAILTMAILLSCAFVACDKVDTDKTGTDIVADYKVTIHPNNGQGDIVWDITKEIPTITKDGYHIAGYFLDAQLTISTTLESLKATGITKNIDVYVKWEEDVCEHVEVTDVAVAPTCTEKGLTEGKHCSKCGKILTAQTEIDALGHDLENHAGQPATCTEKGWKEYVTCKREGCDYTTYEEIPALGHTEVIDNAIAPTCTEKGKTEGKHCSVCNEVIVAQTDIAALGHDIEHHDKKMRPAQRLVGMNMIPANAKVVVIPLIKKSLRSVTSILKNGLPTKLITGTHRRADTTLFRTRENIRLIQTGYALNAHT